MNNDIDKMNSQLVAMGRERQGIRVREFATPVATKEPTQFLPVERFWEKRTPTPQSDMCWFISGFVVGAVVTVIAAAFFIAL